jgi:predicted membrane channel-forming protein YqfA (hemolysin III family)
MNTLLTTALMLMNAWSMQSALLIMIGITMLGVLLQLAQHWPSMRRRLR